MIKYLKYWNYSLYTSRYIHITYNIIITWRLLSLFWFVLYFNYFTLVLKEKIESNIKYQNINSWSILVLLRLKFEFLLTLDPMNQINCFIHFVIFPREKDSLWGTLFQILFYGSFRPVGATYYLYTAVLFKCSYVNYTFYNIMRKLCQIVCLRRRNCCLSSNIS